MSFFKEARETPGQLFEITEETYEQMRDVLPPICARDCFAMGEPVAHTNDGVTFYWAAKRGGAFFGCYGTRAQAQRAFSR